MFRWMLCGATAIVVAGIFVTPVLTSRAGGGGVDNPVVQRGRYLVRTSGCNDCHTPGYVARNGDVPEARWLVGDTLGYSGPWGTTYPTNLRRHLSTMDENAWVDHARTLKTRPPMPWFNVRAFAEDDLRAIYRYIRSLPSDDTPVPEYVPPDRKPTTRHIVMTPVPPEP